MNKSHFVFIGILFIVGGFVLTVLFLLFGSRTKPPSVNEGTPHFGSSTATNLPPVIKGDNRGKSISITTADGGRLQTKDFKNDPAMTRDRINAGRYYLGFNLTNDPTEKAPYLIGYVETGDFFNVVLLQEPIGQSRKEAERYLMERLGISQNQMCTLRHTVSVPYFVNAFYTGMSLGFSFCPGSVVIP